MSKKSKYEFKLLCIQLFQIKQGEMFLSNQYPVKRPTLMQLARSRPKRGESATSGGAGAQRSFKQAYLEVQGSLDGKTKDRMGRLRQMGTQGEEDFRNKYATQALPLKTNGFVKPAEVNGGTIGMGKERGPLSGAQSQQKRVMSAKFGLMRSPTPKDQQAAKQAYQEMATQPGTAFMNKTLHSKPTTADSLPGGRRRGDREQALKTVSASNESPEKKFFRMMSGRSGATVGGTHRAGRTRATKHLALEQNKQVLHGSSRHTTAMSINNKSEGPTRAKGATSTQIASNHQQRAQLARSNNDQSSLLDHTNLTFTAANKPRLGGAEIFSEERLINDEFSTSVAHEAQEEPGRIRSKFRTRNQQTTDTKVSMSQDVSLLEQRGPGHGDFDFQADQANAARAKKSRLIIYGNAQDDDSLDHRAKNYQQKEDAADTFLQNFYEKNRGKAPQVVIDKIRKQTESTKQEGERLRQRIQEFDKVNTRIRKETRDQKEKTQQAMSDKFEIMRDLATYEHNFGTEKSESENMNLSERLVKAIHSIQEVRAKCSRSLSQSEIEQLKASAAVKDGAVEDGDSQNSRPGTGENSRAGLGFEAQKNYLLSLIASLENYRKQRMALEKNKFALLDDYEEDFNLATQYSAELVPALSKEQGDQKNLRSSKLEGSMYDSRTSIEKKKNRRNQRLMKLVNKAQATSHQSSKSPRAEKEEALRESAGRLPRGSEKRGRGSARRLTTDDERADKSTARNPCLAINSNFSRDEQLYTRMSISGCDCLVQALFHNGLIKGQVSVAGTSDQIKFDLHPVLNERFHAVNIFHECKRIFFDVQCNTQGELYLKLLMKSKAQFLSDNQTKLNFIVKLKGSTNRISSLEIANNAKDRTFTAQTKVFHTLNLKQQEIFEIKSQNVSETFPYEKIAKLIGSKVRMEQLPTINLRIVADTIQKKLCIYQKPDRNYAFVEVRQAAEVFESDMPTISKQLGHLASGPRNRRGVAWPPERPMISSWLTTAEKRAAAVEQEKRRSSGTQGQLALDHVELNRTVTEEGPPVGRLEDQAMAADPTDAQLLDGLQEHLDAEVEPAKQPSLLEATQLADIKRRRSATTLTQRQSRMSAKMGPLPVRCDRVGPGNFQGSYQIVEEQEGDASVMPEREPQVHRFYLRHSNTATALEVVENFQRRHRSVDIAQVKNSQKARIQHALRNKLAHDQQQHNIVGNTDYNMYKLESYSRDQHIRKDLQERQALDEQMDHFMLFYGKRMVNSQKRYRIVANQKIKQTKLDLQRVKDQSILFQEYKLKLKEQFQGCKNRARDQSTYTKRKYHRLAKIYQKNFISLLYESKKVISAFAEGDRDNPAFNILYLFFQIRNQFCLLLGREKQEHPAEGAEEESDQSDKISKTSSQQNKLIEVDDDSPYFLRITINPQFMYLLDDTNLPLTSEEIAYACKESLINIFRENRIFKDIVRREVQQMFKERKVIDLQTDLANAVAAEVQKKSSRMSRVVDPPKQEQVGVASLRGSMDVVKGPLDTIVPERINEESEEDVQTKAGRGRAGDATGGDGNVDEKNNALGQALAAELIGQEGVAIGEHLKLPADSVNQPTLSQDNSMPDVKNKYNVIKSLDGNPLAAAWASSERPADAKGALPAEPINDGQVRRSEDVATAAKLALGDHQGVLDRRTAKASKQDHSQAAASAPAAAIHRSSNPASVEPPAVTAEVQDALFEEAMDQIVGNYSIVLNFNS